MPLFQYYSMLNSPSSSIRLRPYKRKRRGSASSDKAAPKRKWTRYWEDQIVDDYEEEESESEEEDSEDEPEVVKGQGQGQGQVQEPEVILVQDCLPEQSEPIDPRNIFQNPLILSKILSFLPLPSLKSVRGVNSFWKGISAPYYASRSLLELNTLSPRLSRSPRDFLEAELRGLPSSNLRLVRVDTRDPGLGQILQKFGTGVKSLEVDAVASGADEEFGFPKNFFLQISTWCPALTSLTLRNLPDSLIDSGFPPLMRGLMLGAARNLTSLNLTCVSYYCGLESHFLLDLLDWAPNLRSLSFNLEDDDSLEEVFLALEIRGAHPQLRNLEQLTFGPASGSTLYETQVQTLASLELRGLKALDLGRLGIDVETETVSRLLQGLSGTLTKLKIGRVHLDGLEFPRMPHLQELDLGNVAIENHAPFFESFQKLRKCSLDGVTVIRSSF